MSAPSEDELRREASRAWRDEARAAALPPASATILLVASAAVGALTIVGVGVRLSMLFAGRPWPTAIVIALGGALAAAMVGVPLGALTRRRARARSSVAAARADRANVSCPRCEAPLLARAEVEAGARSCGACGATLLEAEGLLIAHASEPRWRELRWRSAARSRLPSAAEPGWLLSPVLWTAASMAGLGVLWSTAAAVGGVPAQTVEAPLALDRQVSLHGTAHAASEPAPMPAGPSTRPFAPPWMGTQVLARRGEGPHHELGVIVRVDDGRAFVVYASGASGWVSARDLLAPELAAGDAIEIAEGSSFAPAELLERVGEALHVRRGDGSTTWTSAAVMRVRTDARHRSGEGIDDRIPASAWIEAHVGGVLRPGLQVEAEVDGTRAYVAFSDGSARWVDRDDVAVQSIGPGTTVWIDGEREPRIVAARVGHALAVVDARGARSWTALSRVRRSAP